MSRFVLHGSRRSETFASRVFDIALNAAAVLLVGTALAEAADGGRLSDGGRHRPIVASIEPSLMAKVSPSRFMRMSALAVAPVPATAAPERYARFDHLDMRTQQVASFVSSHRTEATADAGGDRFISDQAKPMVASLGSLAKESAAADVLAYASASPRAEGGALAAINSAAGIGADIYDEEDEDAEALLLPQVVPLPQARPLAPAANTSDADAEATRRTEKPNSDGRSPVGKAGAEQEVKTPDSSRPAPKAVAMARPNLKGGQDDESSPGLFKKLFSGRPRAGNGVAVYDISAGKVYMPDGSVLAAASGIGKMANNPKYAHVKMNGPTPPHTYNLKMRETRFHGVEAIRMLPVDGKNKYGRDGFLAHTQLLRGRPGQSHGCVAFEDYEKFLRAFKQGKVKQMVVVPGGGAGVFARKAGKDNDV